MMQRRTAIAKKRLVPRTRRCVCGVRTSEKRCEACGLRRGGKRTTLRKRADALWSEIVRSRGACEAAGLTSVRCGGVLQAAHGFPRTYYATRWVVLNGFCICAGHHRWFTSKPIEWTVFMLERLGQHPFEELRRIALANDSQPDYVQIIKRLRESGEQARH